MDQKRISKKESKEKGEQEKKKTKPYLEVDGGTRRGRAREEELEGVGDRARSRGHDLEATGGRRDDRETDELFCLEWNAVWW